MVTRINEQFKFLTHFNRSKVLRTIIEKEKKTRFKISLAFKHLITLGRSGYVLIITILYNMSIDDIYYLFFLIFHSTRASRSIYLIHMFNVFTSNFISYNYTDSLQAIEVNKGV